MKYTEFAKKIAREQGAVCIESRPDWDGKEVWSVLLYDPEKDEEIPCTGYPEYIVLDKDGYFITDPDQAMEYMRYVDQHFGYDDEGNIPDFSCELIRVD